MSKELPTQFPAPPELQPIPPVQVKLWQFASLVLIVAGLALLGLGGWLFYQYQLEAGKPPPARILEVSAPVTPDAPGLDRASPTAPPTEPALEVAAAATPVTSTPVGPPVTAAHTPTLEFTSAGDVVATPLPVAAQEEIDALVISPTVVATVTVAASTPTPEELHSLADNPLLVQEEILTPVAPAEAAPLPDLLPASSPPTHITAESIGLDAGVIEVGWQEISQNGVATNVWIVADYAAGWHKNSALPGQGGNVVLSGHHNIKGEVFRHTIDLNIGDIVTLYVGDQPYRYAVIDKFIVKDKGEPEAVRRENAKWIGPFNEERLTLVTCWPYTNNTHRAIVIARPVDATP